MINLKKVGQILSKEVAAPLKISQVFRKNFGAKNGITLNIPLKTHEPIDFYNT